MSDVFIVIGTLLSPDFLDCLFLMMFLLARIVYNIMPQDLVVWVFMTNSEKKNLPFFNKKRIKTWWFRKKAVPLHPLFVARVPGALSLTLKF